MVLHYVFLGLLQTFLRQKPENRRKVPDISALKTNCNTAFRLHNRVFSSFASFWKGEPKNRNDGMAENHPNSTKIKRRNDGKAPEILKDETEDMGHTKS